MSRKKIRVPGRYERPPALRGPLGDRMTEAGIRDGYTASARARQAVRDARHDGVLEATPDGQGGAALLHGIAPVVQTLNRRRSVATVESDTGAGVLERVEICESGTGGVKAVQGKPAEVVIDIIRSGWNKSGGRFYPSEVLERDVPLVYPKGSHMYINHPGQVESEDRPERSLYDLAAVFTSTPYAVREGDQTVMRATARVFSRHREFLAEARDDIGVSINGNGDGTITEREGRTGLVLERLTYGQSVDFVTKPGAGGRIIALMEADRPTTTLEAATLGTWLESRMHLGFTEIADNLYGDGRLTRTERIAASSAVGDALAAFVAKVEAAAPALYQRDRWGYPPEADAETREAITVEAAVEQQRAAIEQAVHAQHRGENRYAWVRDFDPDAGLVWFEAGAHDTSPRLWQQAYTRTGPVAALSGEPVEVRARTVYDPCSPVAITESTAGGPPAGSTADEATNAKENVMTDTTVKDAAAREAAEATRTRESYELAQYRQSDKARSIVDGKLAESSLTAPAQNRIRAGLPATSVPLHEADRSLNVAAWTATVETAIKAETDYVASILEAAGVGLPAGNGAAAGAGSGMPAGFVPSGAGAHIPATFGAGSASAVGGQEVPADLRESLIQQITSRGQTREAAERAIDRF